MSEISAFGINFSRFDGIFKIEKIQYKTHPNFETKLVEKSVSYTQAYTLIALKLIGVESSFLLV